jgi:hypothetical protein
LHHTFDFRLNARGSPICTCACFLIMDKRDDVLRCKSRDRLVMSAQICADAAFLPSRHGSSRSISTSSPPPLHLPLCCCYNDYFIPATETSLISTLSIPMTYALIRVDFGGGIAIIARRLQRGGVSPPSPKPPVLRRISTEYYLCLCLIRPTGYFES